MVTCKACKKNFHKKKAANMAKTRRQMFQVSEDQAPVKTGFL